jgi:hypothetical protein
MAGTANLPERSIPWRMIFRIVRWVTYTSALVTLILVLHKVPPPLVETNPQAAARADQKFEQVQQAVSNGQPATLRMDQTELNSYLLSHLDIAANPAPAAPASSNSNAAPATSAPAASPSEPAPTGTPAEQIEQARSAVKDVKVELIEDRARAYVVFDFHGKDMTLQLEGKLGARDGYLQFEPVAGQIGAFPIPQATLETAVRHLMESPENRDKLKLPADVSNLKIENGEVILTYK